MTNEQERRVQVTIEQLTAGAGSYEQFHDRLDLHRQTWWEERGRFVRLVGTLPRQAYTLFLLENLGLDPSEVPVIYESDTLITWRSFNFCPVLEACVRLGLDTRQVCRMATEASVTNLIAHLDPRLRFSRNYLTGIRPYAAYCEESITLVSS